MFLSSNEILFMCSKTAAWQEFKQGKQEKNSEICFKSTLTNQAKMLMYTDYYESGRFSAKLLNYLNIKGSSKMTNIALSVWETKEKKRASSL